MKKIVFFALLCAIFGSWGQLQAQNCDILLRPYFLRNNIDPNEYPEGKAEWRCLYAQSAFYLTNDIPENAPVYDISEVFDYLTGKYLDKNFVVDLQGLSYYGYNFIDFQQKNDKKTVYFRLRSGQTKYLALRSIIEMSSLAEQATMAILLQKEKAQETLEK